MFNLDISAQSGGGPGNGNIQNWACVCNWPDGTKNVDLSKSCCGNPGYWYAGYFSAAKQEWITADLVGFYFLFFNS